MDQHLQTLTVENLRDIQEETKQQAILALESGKVVYLPFYSFFLTEKEQALLSDTILDGKHKNISYDYRQKRLGGFQKQAAMSELAKTTEAFMQRFAEYAKALITELFPEYQDALQWGRTSYRPAEIKGRKSSKRKDDTRLHVDSFPSSPVHGKRILRVFCNINPYGEPRVWNLGEPFTTVLSRFISRVPNYNPIQAKILRFIKATKSLRSRYDHYMLHIHDMMKLDDQYQEQVKKQQIDFPPASSWIVFTDKASHAALSGQFLLEQTFYLPAQAMKNPDLSPLKILENALDTSIV